MLRGEVNMTKWCNTYGCWCVDVEEITDSQYSCNLNCDDCEGVERIELFARQKTDGWDVWGIIININMLSKQYI